MKGGFMLWRKGWWDTREFFQFALALMTLVCVFILKMGGKAGLADYQKMVWALWFRLTMTMMWPILAMFVGMTILRSVPLLDGPPGATGLFTLSLPITRRKIILSHWAVFAMEMTLISLAQVPLIGAISRFNGHWFPIKDAILYSLFMVIGGMAFVSLSYLLIVIFKNNAWAILVPVVMLNILLHWPRWIIGGYAEYPWWNIFHVMSGESYFHQGKIPWLGLFASLAVSALMMLAAVRIYERRDF
jgi:hypothetical protein